MDSTEQRPSSVDTARKTATKQQRVLSCIQCQHRKIKCNRHFPCKNCEKIGRAAECEPAALQPRQRRRRFAERDLLDRIRQYEDLLRSNSISFKPLHGSSTAQAIGKTENPDIRDTADQHDALDEATEGLGNATLEPGNEDTKPRDFWRAMNQNFHDSEREDEDDSDYSLDGVHESTVRQIIEPFYTSKNDILFGSRNTSIRPHALHPSQVHIFKLWQIYLENVNPLFKVTHTPTLQGRLIEAAGSPENVSASLSALMFSIYCISVVSLDDEDCITMFASPKSQLFERYQVGCQQSLFDSDFMRTTDLECLTALFLYLASLRPDTVDPRSVGALMGTTTRVAQRMGLQNDRINAKCTIFEAEMRRRLWWAIVLLDHRICEMSNQPTTTLIPGWNCKTPKNVDDFDLWPEMKTPPDTRSQPTEAIFVVVRSGLSNLARYNASHLDFVNPSLKPLAKPRSELADLEKAIGRHYLNNCNPENSLHYMTIWTARRQTAHIRLLQYYSSAAKAPSQQTESQKDEALTQAMVLLGSDTQLMTSPLTRAYMWFTRRFFPFPALVHIFRDLKKRPTSKLATKAWEVADKNFRVRYTHASPFFKIAHKLVLQAWEARRGTFPELPDIPVPHMVTDFQKKLSQMSMPSQPEVTDRDELFANLNLDEFMLPLPIDLEVNDLPEAMTTLDSGSGGQNAFDLDWNQWDWANMDWNMQQADIW